MERYLATLDHEQMLVRRGDRSGVFCIVAVHSTARGPALGGCRMWRYDDSFMSKAANQSAFRDVASLLKSRPPRSCRRP